MEDLELFKKYYNEIKEDLEAIIKKCNKEIIINKNGYLKDNLELFSKLNDNGKLIRGFLIVIGYKIAKNKNYQYSYNLALAYEIFQTSVLIHDDIIDNDNLRRGVETIHYANYKKNKDIDDNLARKQGDSIAICMGDYGFFIANKIINNNYRNDKNFYKVFDYYNDIVLKTIEGELIDVELSFDGRYRLKDKNLYDGIMQIYKLKTAYYTIIGPLSLGLILGGMEDEKLSFIKEFGEKIGIAFQIQDDILGIYSDLGKVIGSDIKEYKETLLYSYVIENKDYKDELLKYYGKENITKEELDKVRDIFKESGALDYATNIMNNLYDEALNILKEINWINQENKMILKGFVEYLRTRNK